MNIPYLIQRDNIVLVIDNKSHTITRGTHLSYEDILSAIKLQDWDTVRDLVEPKVALINYGKGNIEIKDSVIYWKGKEFHNSLSTRMISMFTEGFPIEPMIKFMENLMLNPSKRSVDELYGFLDRNKLPLTEDGYFLAFKRVNHDFKDIHSGTFDNSVGSICEVDRNTVDDQATNTCSTGLHFCSESYLSHFGSEDQPVMILKINPADVVSIPTDYNGAKGRCCRYEVVGQLDVPTELAASEEFTSTVNVDYGIDSVKSSEQLYDVVRVSDSTVIVARKVTFSVAKEMIAKNIRQKKAQLMMLPIPTNNGIN